MTIMMTTAVGKRLLSIVVLALVAISVARAQSLAPLREYKLIYITKSPKVLQQIFDREYAYACKHRSLFKSVLIDVVRINDNVDLRHWYTRKGPRPELFDRRRMKQAIRFMVRANFALGELPPTKVTSKLAIEQYEKTLALPYEKRVFFYFTTQAQQTLAKVAPEYLVKLIKKPHFEWPALGLLSLLRHSKLLIDDKMIREVIERKDERFGLSLLHYMSDEKYRLSILKRHFSLLSHWRRHNRLSRARDVINGLAAFSLGRTELHRLRHEKKIDYIKLGPVYAFTLPEEGIKKAALFAQLSKLSKAAKLVAKSNALFSDKEPLYAIHLTKAPRTKAGWSFNSLFINMKTLQKLSKRAAALTILHEACEQRFIKGYFSCGLGASYINLLLTKPAALSTVSLGNRIGGNYKNSSLGHPWDSEREWLAELASVYILKEEPLYAIKEGLTELNSLLEQGKAPK